ncbi:3-deoxy-D-manno-octulosonic acid kinase [Pusillimonas sp. CC-YST705]|uniref:3-deoxy-D-manno-octulosonic acid kinase n=1 Tax=Mesopusillimonas faecipullorum TaxID=2755040 RepID=A0ABS8C8F0_9BURK|nr:3-deoxy-D-manno-octulosonic acid kinase [Mesopusillimonas faecipullorum]MCB5362147.1 3-deoxy-D-manno-octulosonic acid kinase [Mesopusillimonas faecipullorum]
MTKDAAAWRDIAVPGNLVIRVQEDWAEQAQPAWFDPATPALQAEAVGVGGRQAAWFVAGPFGEGVLRHYRRGGLVAKVLKEHYFWLGAGRTRSFQEFAIMDWMHARALPVPGVIAAACWRQGLVYRAAIIVQRLLDVTPVAKKLAHADAVAQAVRAMHDAGVWHADLNAFNILLDKSGKAWLIDFDRAKHQFMTRELRQNNLLRLRRSLIKVAGEAGHEYWQQVNQIYHNC